MLYDPFFSSYFMHLYGVFFVSSHLYVPSAFFGVSYFLSRTVYLFYHVYRLLSCMSPFNVFQAELHIFNGVL
jgi:hypothetical protein